MMNERFGKSYKLCSRKVIASIFAEGRSVRHYPFLVQFVEQPVDPASGAGGGEQPFQLVFSAPKRTFRKAHERNRIKRLLREAFRKKKLILEEALRQHNKQLALFVIYTAKEELPLPTLLSKTAALLEKITQELTHETTQK